MNHGGNDNRNTASYVRGLDKFYATKLWQDTTREILRLVTPGSHVMDFGSSTGHMLQSIAQQYPSAKLYGADSSPLMREVSRLRVPDATILRKDVNISIPDMDLMLCLWVLGLVADPWSELRRMRLCLGDTGSIALLIPSKWYPYFFKPLYSPSTHWMPAVRWKWSLLRMTALLESSGFKEVRYTKVGKQFLKVPEGYLITAKASVINEVLY